MKPIRDVRPFRSLTLLTAAILATASITGTPVQAQSGFGASVQNDQQAGWIEDMAGMRHFSGLRCPDVVGSLARAKVLASDTQHMSGCIYIGSEGMNAVLRQHLKGQGRAALATFQSSFASAGFKEVKLTGISGGGVSFRAREWEKDTHVETLWQFEGRTADYTLWLHYVLPKHETDVGTIVSAFKDMLARQN